MVTTPIQRGPVLGQIRHVYPHGEGIQVQDASTEGRLIILRSSSLLCHMLVRLIAGTVVRRHKSHGGWCLTSGKGLAGPKESTH